MEKYIPRDMEGLLLSASDQYSGVLVTGPRQTGKSTMLKHASDGKREVVSLDDVQNRITARTSPRDFLSMHEPPVIIDEVQYAPELFPYIKTEIDGGAPKGSYWLTASGNFRPTGPEGESLAGRVACLHMTGLSQNELHGRDGNVPFAVESDSVLKRRAVREKTDEAGIYERIFRGGFPGFVSGEAKSRDTFYAGYLDAFFNRDLRDEIREANSDRFYDFTRAVACRIAQPLNVHALASDVGVSDDTAKRWLSALEKADMIFHLHPYFNNLLKRTVKMRKLYFSDTGLAAYLTRFSSADALRNSPYSGAFLENYVVSEIRKTYLNAGAECCLHYYRDTQNKEIDLVLESDEKLHPVEIKKSGMPGPGATRAFDVLRKASLPVGQGAVVCLSEDMAVAEDCTLLIPVWTI